MTGRLEKQRRDSTKLDSSVGYRLGRGKLRNGARKWPSGRVTNRYQWKKAAICRCFRLYYARLSNRQPGPGSCYAQITKQSPTELAKKVTPLDRPGESPIPIYPGIAVFRMNSVR